jgi:hypothetical protein
MVCWPAEVYAALWLGALLVAAGELPDPFPPPIEELARRSFEVYPLDRGDRSARVRSAAWLTITTSPARPVVAAIALPRG